MKISTQLPMNPITAHAQLKQSQKSNTVTNSLPFDSAHQQFDQSDSKAPTVKAQVNSLKVTDLSVKYHQDTGLIQSIVTDNLTEDIIRKIPSDEYLELLRLVDEYISQNIDKQA